ncbi:MAG: flagellar biosynthesis protein FlhB [Lachnospiraceae bacterium]|nr:flagellar biosynthesis protein FlhB [Lachnospiraceae bacterium]
MEEYNIASSFRIRIKYNLQFFAEGEGGEKTEQATPKKLEKAREEGQVAKSQDLLTGVILISMFVFIKLFAGFVANRFLDGFKEMYGYISLYSGGNFTTNIARAIINRTLVIILIAAIPFLLCAYVLALVMNIAQVGLKPSPKALQPKFDKLNPAKGIKNIISGRKVVELIKAILKIIVIVAVVYNTLKDQQNLIKTLYDYDVWTCIKIIGDVVLNLAIKISFLLLIIGFADLFYQKYKFNKDMMMTKQELKDEYKQSEGDPQIKGQIRRRMQESSMRRMMQDLPQADVVITNPTHFAVAIKYDNKVDTAPVVIAKGEDYLAQKIKEKAREYNIELYEDRPLARMLYYNVEIGEQIPPELYQMVAEVLAHVYSLNTEGNE